MDRVTHGSPSWREVGRACERRPTSSPLHLRSMVLPWIVLGLAAGAASAKEGESAAAFDGGRRLYVTGIVGSSLGGDSKQDGWIGDVATPTLGGDAAIGVAIDRSSSAVKGGVRVEFEGRTRPRGGGATAADVARPQAVGCSATDWSTMANLWRDVSITEHLGGYAGGGLGAGGGRDAAGDPRSGFAWQVGGGVTYALNDRITLDAGYRAVTSSVGVRGGHGRADLPDGEILFSVRLYEPFRGWLRD